MEEERALVLGDFIRIFKKQIKLILLITILSTFLAGILSFLIIEPTYEAKSTIVVGKADRGSNDNPKYQFDDIMMYKNLITTYAEIGRSASVAENASKMLKDVSTKDILDSIIVIPKEDTQLIEFKVQNENPQEAYRILNAVCNAFMEEGERIYSGQNIKVIDGAKIPEEPIKPNKLLNIAIAFFIGMVVSMGLAVLREYMDNTLKVEEDINKYLGIPVIGVIPKDVGKY
ncbi:YveK family protein [Clostridium cellulovorans]|uniref:Lipopolysaccharide biosynthesis protein n=1 Tax=Clostridium cellulovorans (strain ATCC 35296 / DSM 3052 / OCM 3 / 743B) TaxID=573061 RepID=D9ST43_CLOC7|nr:Wzz/FepE/Etk N-terminal domain-containing protein [Clostridium cellulovorans]ADL50659.1 lipopolysaccharide biosynthesis protein [Clostridium cellulovorans 743B]